MRKYGTPRTTRILVVLAYSEKKNVLVIDFVHKASLLIRIGYSIEIVPNIDISSQFTVFPHIVSALE